MPSIFSSLGIGVSGLSAAQIQISTTGNNITNADSDYYTRQRVVQSASPAMNYVPGGVGTGTQVDTIVRIHDEFTFARLKVANNKFEDSSYKQQILEQASKYFPDLQDSSIERDIGNYFKAWNDFASNPNEGSQKVNLINFAQSLSAGIKNTSTNLRNLQEQIDSSLSINVQEINNMAREIASINKEIERVESGRDAGIAINANDLRDRRDRLELAMAKLVNVTSFKSDLRSNTPVNTGITDQGKYYTLNIGGMSVVDGVNYHPLKVLPNAAGTGFSNVYYELRDGKLISMEDKINGGKMGAALDLRGRHYNSLQKKFEDGDVQKYIDHLDTLAKTIIRSTNNIYAGSAMNVGTTDPLNYLQKDKTLMNFSGDIKEGSFDVVVYNNLGAEIARKTISINGTTTMNDTSFGNSIVSDFNSDSDDNADNDNTNDVNDYFFAGYYYDNLTNQGTFSVTPRHTQGQYTIAFEDKGTNFPGVIGINRFFDGDDAHNMRVADEIVEDHTKLNAYSNPTSGNRVIANKMIQLQHDSIEFYSVNGRTYDKTDTIEGYYRFITTDLASDTQSNNITHDTNIALLNTANAEFESVSGVDVNEELTNLIRFQSSYGAAAKIITTVDKMLDTLLSLKQ